MTAKWIERLHDAIDRVVLGPRTVHMRRVNQALREESRQRLDEAVDRFERRCTEIHEHVTHSSGCSDEDGGK